MKKIKFILAILAILLTFQVEAQKPNKSTVNNLPGYASFGEKFTPNKVLSKDAMLKKYKNLKKGDSIPVQFKTTINSVCKKKGCWMKLDLGKGESSFVKFKDYGFFVPLNADGNEVIVNGYAFVDIVTVDELKHYAKDGGKSKEEIAKIKKPEVTYSFTATGVYIKK
ncbi:DUF4920 domain-containing protein [Flavobacterium sp. HXWNR69]|uniref:DUF4920 domain-containing protein n=1 Tax=Flavobacterium fragile TaxID=2949085 RepID=A0ABT0TGH7_9FLAO|nr:DUF4920 domain-containing protein [Flavobacterium sp. HXWNR69]MCL9770076.1 DUF4920 domain-containing protein [Flavobacterium sp. HXWNR69]